jgi:hypothetical protein
MEIQQAILFNRKAYDRASTKTRFGKIITQVFIYLPLPFHNHLR